MQQKRMKIFNFMQIEVKNEESRSKYMRILWIFKRNNFFVDLLTNETIIFKLSNK